MTLGKPLRLEAIYMNKITIPALNAKGWTAQQEKNFAEFWMSRGWSEDKVNEALVFAEDVTDAEMIRCAYDNLKAATDWLPASTIDYVKATLIRIDSLEDDAPWQGSFKKDGSYGIASIYRNGKRTTTTAHRLVDFLVTGRFVPQGFQLDHVNHNPATCDWDCQCTRSVLPTQLALVERQDNLYRSNASSGYLTEGKTTCKYGHEKRGLRNCPSCKAEYDFLRNLRLSRAALQLAA